MKAARKVGDAKKHECTFTCRPHEPSSDPLYSKTRVHGLIRSNPPVMLCVRSHSQHDFRPPVLCFRFTQRSIQKVHGNRRQKKRCQ